MVTAATQYGKRLPQDVESAVRSKMGKLCMLPDIASQAIDISRDPNSCIDEFSGVVERDAKLATDILSMANSVIFSSGRPILGLSQAVMRLGMQQCRNLIYSSGMASLMNKLSLDEEWIREALYRHGFVTALLSLRLNHILKIGCQGEEFTFGLMHDFGRTLLAVTYPDRFSQIDAMTFLEDDIDYLKNERSVIGADHCQLGAWFAQDNGLPGTLVEAIRLHHFPERAVLNPRLTALTAISDHIASHIQRDEPPSQYCVEANPGVPVLESIGVRGVAATLTLESESLIERVIAEADELMNL